MIAKWQEEWKRFDLKLKAWSGIVQIFFLQIMIKWLRHKPEVDLKFDNLLLGHGLQKYDLDDLVHI